MGPDTGWSLRVVADHNCPCERRVQDQSSVASSATLSPTALNEDSRGGMNGWMRGGAIVVAFVLVWSTCCGNTQLCLFTSLNVSPSTATVAVGHSQTFIAFGGVRIGCAAMQSNLTNVIWTASNPDDVTLTFNQGTANLTCVNAATVTITSTLPASANDGRVVTGTGTLICQ